MMTPVFLTSKQPGKGTVMDKAIERRTFLQAAAAGLLVLPSGSLFGAATPNGKLNIALIGAYGRAIAHYDGLARENVVAICDVDETHLDFANEKFPKAKRYVDWRKCLDHKNLDAVVICTLDHTHAFVANWAMNRGLHVYCEKPLANSVEEARVVRATYLKHKDKLATQVGTQRHVHENFNRIQELIRDGAVGELKSVCAWGNRQIPKPGYLPAAGTPPKNLHYDLWIGPSPMHPYNPEYFSGQPGANCLQWNMYWDFGSGQVGDMGSHTMDIAWNALDAGLPTSAEATGDPVHPEVTPVKLAMTCEIPANDWRPAVPVTWYQGGAMPDNPNDYVDLNKVGHGAMFKGTKGTLVAGFETRALLPNSENGDLTYYTPRTEDKLLRPVRNFQREWIDACKGGLVTSCDFDYGGKMIEMMMLGLVAYRAGKKVDYDSENGRVTNSPEADALLRREYRKGWTLNG
ncbi:MAG: Gfo/Idh/MocA family oxidoreductase [Candidatus Hydrogenedens sp.]|nr:Gfo/Idh/MocA family oxidoreductase [Candidatus Hydrogenedentota bacterium]NLF57174.1 Gfo/Idh/MocA family oxidoreductase [Candidatus Hydrogenedens sp.]